MLKVLVTGANGFLASNIIIELLNRNYLVRGMMRKTARLAIDHTNFEIFQGNITDAAHVSKAAEGCDIIMHVAAVTDQSIARYYVYENINVGGTRNVIDAAISHKIKKVVYVSTANAFGYGTKLHPGNEKHPPAAPFTRSGYALSKLKAQELVIAALRNSDTKVTVVNPTFMIGPNDHKVSSNRLILRALNKRLLFIPRGGKNFIHVQDVAKGACNAIDMGENGECYILANENLTYREFYSTLSQITGKKYLMVTVPEYFLLLAGVTGSLFRFAGINSEVGLTNMRIINLGNYYSSGKAVKALNLPQTPVLKAIEDTIHWFGIT